MADCLPLISNYDRLFLGFSNARASQEVQRTSTKLAPILCPGLNYPPSAQHSSQPSPSQTSRGSRRTQPLNVITDFSRTSVHRTLFCPKLSGQMNATNWPAIASSLPRRVLPRRPTLRLRKTPTTTITTTSGLV